MSLNYDLLPGIVFHGGVGLSELNAGGIPVEPAKILQE